MASTYSDRLRLELIATGEKNGTWGTTTNTNLGTLIEEAISGYVAVTHSDAASYTLTTQNGATDEARNMVLNIGGALTAARNVVCPTKEKLYVVRNSTTGGFGFTFKTSGGTGIVVPNGKTMVLYCDGTNVLEGVNAVSSALQIYDSSDATKRAIFDVSAITTATTRTYILPNATTTIVGTDVAQTISNKTLGGNLAAGTFKITGIGDGSARTDSLSLGQAQDDNLNWVAAGGTANAITATYSPAITTLVDGQICAFRASDANSTTTPTFTPNGLTARTIVKTGGSALVAGDIPAANAEVLLRYNLANTRWELLNPAYAASAASTTDVLTGTSGVKFVTPNALAALWEAGSPITDGAVITVGEGAYFQLNTSTATITSIAVTDDKAGRTFRFRFNTARTIQHTGGLLILPGFADIAAAAGDVAQFRSLGSGNVICEWYTRASGLPVVETPSLTLGTSQASTSGTSIDFTSIPSGTKRITISFSEVSMSGTSNPIIQIGDAGGVEATGYRSYSSRMSNNGVANGANYTTGFGIASSDAAASMNGSVVLSLIDAASFLWAANGFIADSNTAYGFPVSGAKALSATLDRVRITTAGGVNTFDAGTINIMYE